MHSYLMRCEIRGCYGLDWPDRRDAERDRRRCITYTKSKEKMRGKEYQTTEQEEEASLRRHRFIPANYLTEKPMQERPIRETALRNANSLDMRAWKFALLQAVVGTMLSCLVSVTLAAGISVDELLNWAEATYPGFFPGHQSTLNSAPYLYRYYSLSGNYVGVADGVVFVYGPISGNALLAVGKVDDFTCQVAPERCAAVSIPKSARLIAATNAFCGIRSDQQVMCWGTYPAGTNFRAGYPFPPMVVPGISGAVALASSGGSICVLLNTGRIACWGQNLNNQAGGGESGGPYTVPGIDDAVDLVGGVQFLCALKRSGQVACWGDIPYQKTFLLGPSILRVDTPTVVPGLSDVISLSAAYQQACAVTRTGSILCWGAAAVIPWDASQPTRDVGLFKLYVVPQLTDAKIVAAGYRHACAIRVGGSVACWGDDTSFALDGRTDYGSSSIPVAVSGISNAIELSAGFNTTCVLTRENATLCWGEVQDHRKYIGSLLNAGSAPTRLAALDGFIALVRKFDYGPSSCAIRLDGAMFCWGLNSANQLGQSTPTFWSTPVAVPGFF